MTKQLEGTAPRKPARAAADPAPAETRPVPASTPFVPFSQSRLALLSVDASRAFTYWNVQPLAIAQARRRIDDPQAPLALRFHDVTLVDFDGTNANQTFEVAIEALAGNHYLSLGSAGKSLVAEVGVKGADGRFAAVARSNFLSLPRDAESPRFEDRRRRAIGISSPLWQPRALWPAEAATPGRVAEAALAAEDDEPLPHAPAARHGPETPWTMAPPRAPGGALPPGDGARPGKTPAAARRRRFTAVPAARELEVAGDDAADAPRESTAEARIGRSPEPARVESPSSLERPARAALPYLEVKADIVVYGRAPAGSEVFIDGVPVRVRADGTFDLRFAMPHVPPPAADPEEERPAPPPADAATGQEPW